MKKPGMLVIFLTVFIDLIGFGIVVPLLPIYGRNFGANGFMIGMIMANFSLMQFIFAPIWGRLSDRVGRRPVLLTSTAMAALSYLVFGMGAHLEGTIGLMVLLGSRVVAGICGANITVAQAYIADISPPEERSKKMGMIGMAFGLGFIFGPVIGAVSLNYLDHSGPGYAAACLCAFNFLLALFVLKESRQPNSAQVEQRPHMEQWAHTLKHPQVGILIVVFFLATLCFTCYETTLGLLIRDNFKLDSINTKDAQTVSILFAYGGVIAAFVQGGLIGRMVKSMGELRVIAVSLILVAAGLLPLPFFAGDTLLTWKNLFSSNGGAWWGLLAGVGIMSLGASLTRPPLFGLISILTSPQEQGATLGVAQSMGSLARIIGPLVAGVLYQWHISLPYIGAAIISLFTAALVWSLKGKVHDSKH
jgi:multidrug resistance protein